MNTFLFMNSVDLNLCLLLTHDQARAVVCHLNYYILTTLSLPAPVEEAPTLHLGTEGEL